MTIEQKKQINTLLSEGNGYKRIATVLNLPVNSVKSYCSRHKTKVERCKNCGAPLMRVPHKKAKKFCSDGCRMQWWNKHPEELQHQFKCTKVCPNCKKEFLVFGASQKKFCSRGCYHAFVRKATCYD